MTAKVGQQQQEHPGQQKGGMEWEGNAANHTIHSCFSAHISHPELLTMPVQKHVVWFDVQVEHAAAVQVVQRRGHLEGELENLGTAAGGGWWVGGGVGGGGLRSRKDGTGMP